MSTIRGDVLKTGLALSILMFFYVGSQLFTPVSNFSSEVEITIERGMTFQDAVMILHERRLIKDTAMFHVMGRLSGLSTRLRPGLYVFAGKHNQWSIFKAMNRGEVKIWAITIAPGDNLDVVRGKLVGSGLVTAQMFDSLVRDPEIMNTLGIKSVSLEGYLYAETYNFSMGISAEDILTSMVKKTREVLTPELLDRASALGMNEDELLAMASIIEKEAFMADERRTISAVYHNRLKKGMRLQADPTVVYGIKPQSEGITRADLERPTPYNTYMIRGLPLGPIASPGKAAIVAAANPDDVAYIYFVSNNDGSHVFSRTLKEHQSAVRAYRAKRGAGNGDG